MDKLLNVLCIASGYFFVAVILQIFISVYLFKVQPNENYVFSLSGAQSVLVGYYFLRSDKK